LDPAALRDPKVKAALVNLLDRQNKEPIHGEEEDFADDTSWLSDTVARIVDWNDPRQVCVLANSVDLPDQLGDHTKVAVPCLLRRFKNGLNRYAPGPDISRGSVVAILVQASVRGKGHLDAATMQAVRQIILSALRDPDAGMKIDTVKALGSFGGEDMIQALKVVAATDSDPGEGYAMEMGCRSYRRNSKTSTGVQLTLYPQISPLHSSLPCGGHLSVIAFTTIDSQRPVCPLLILILGIMLRYYAAPQLSKLKL
jgi:hypothetical protein